MTDLYFNMFYFSDHPDIVLAGTLYMTKFHDNIISIGIVMTSQIVTLYEKQISTFLSAKAISSKED